MKNSILTAMIVLASMASCKDKNKGSDNPKPSLSARQQALIGKDWKLTSIKVENKEIIGSLPPCMADNIFHHFTDASKGYMDEGAVKCDQADSQRLNLGWKLIVNESKMVITEDGQNDTFDIVSLNGNVLQYKLEDELLTLKY